MEVAVAAFIMVALAALTADLTIMFLAFNINDSCARDCARAAGGVPSSQQTETLAQAQANAIAAARNQLKVHDTDHYFLSAPVLLTNAPQFQYVTFGWPPMQAMNGNVTQAPYVICTTEIDVNLPVWIPFVKLQNQKIVMLRSYAYPIVTTALGN